MLGRTEEALKEARRAIDLGPLSFYNDYPVWVFILAHRYDLALERALPTCKAAQVGPGDITISPKFMSKRARPMMPFANT